MLNVAESLVTRHDVTVAPGLGVSGRDGRTYSSWYPLQSFLACPLVAIAVPVSRAAHVPLHFVAAVFAGLLPVVFSALTVALVALIALELGSSPGSAKRAALCFAFGTIAVAYHRTFYAEPLLMLLVTAGLYFAFQQTPRSVLAASACALLAVLAKPTGILVGPILAAYLLAKPIVPLRLRLAPGLGALCGLLLYMAYNWLRFANPLTFGQPFSFSILSVPVGTAGLLVSPSRGLLWYCPPVVLAVWGLRKAMRQRRWEALSLVALFIAFLALHSLWAAWAGGWSWGPRFLLPVLPGLMALTGLLEGRSKKALPILALFGFLVNAPTLFSYYERYYAEANEQNVSQSALLWSPFRAPLLHAWPAALREIHDARANDVREILAQRGAPSTTISQSRALRVVALWWWVLPIVHIPRLLGAAASLVMVLIGGWLVVRARFPAADPPCPVNDLASAWR